MAREREHPLISLYKFMAMCGIDPHAIKPDHRNEENTGRLAVAMPDTKTAISLLGDRTDPFLEDDWYISSVSSADVETFSKVFNAVSVLAFEHIRRQSSNDQVKQGSKEEEALLSAILQANLPEPDRNYRVYRENGNELTTPDFTWESLKVAFYMDGLWWHQSRDDSQMLNMLAEAGKDTDKSALLMNQNRTRAQRDADNRSELASMGWQILVCTDADLKSEKDIQKQVKRISQSLRQAAKTQALLKQSGASTQESDTDFDPFANL